MAFAFVLKVSEGPIEQGKLRNRGFSARLFIKCDVNDNIEKVSEVCGHEVEEVVEGKTRKGTVSIDVTKALLLLGFTSWSGIEPGMRVWKI